MPVLMTGFETGLGRATLPALLRGGGEVRVYLDAERSDEDDAARLRARGCKVALGTMDDEGLIESALEQVHTVLHLAGDPMIDPDEQLDALATVAGAAIGAGCRRLVWVSELAASDPGGNGYLEALAAGEALVTGLPMETVLLRCGLRYGPGDAFTRLLAGGLPAQADPMARHEPVWLADVAAAVVVADRQRGSASELHLSVEIVGPDQLALGELAQRLGGAAASSGTTGASPNGGSPPWIAGWLSRDAVGGPQALGRQGTALAEAVSQL